MSVIVKGMKMPESCKYCRFYSPLVGFMCIAANKKYGDDFNPFCKKRPDWCPLVEIKPHGRLIDADVLRQMMHHEAFETDSPMQKWDSGCWIRYKMFERMEEDAPTIIEEEVD